MGIDKGADGGDLKWFAGRLRQRPHKANILHQTFDLHDPGIRTGFHQGFGMLARGQGTLALVQFGIQFRPVATVVMPV